MGGATAEVIDSHRAAGRQFTAGGVRSFVREAGEGEPVVCLHGVPTSSFLYRKVIDELVHRNLRGIAFDYPGLGLADRPPGFDYGWGGLARWTGAALEALGIGRCHLVVHDIAGPIGIEWATRNPERVLSLTVLNTMLGVATFRRPWTMHPFSIRGVGEIYLRAMTRPAFTELFYLQGMGDRSACDRSEAGAYYDLLKRSDGGEAFLRIMRGFELTRAHEDLLCEGLRSRPYPATVLWGRDDPALGLEHCRDVAEVLAVEPDLVAAKHFLQEDRAPAVADSIARVASLAG